MKAFVELTHHPKLDSILLGPIVATFSMGSEQDTFGDVTAGGKLLRVRIKKHPGYVDIDITTAVNKAIEILLAQGGE